VNINVSDFKKTDKIGGTIVKKLVLGVLFSLLLSSSLNLGNVSAATYNYQDVTAYVASPGALTYYGTTPVLYLTAAVKPKICGNPSSGTKLPNGTQILTTTQLSFPDGRLRDTFFVKDMSDPNCTRGLTSYAFDLYFGTNTTSNTQNAINFGRKNVNYNVHLP